MAEQYKPPRTVLQPDGSTGGVKAAHVRPQICRHKPFTWKTHNVTDCIAIALRDFFRRNRFKEKYYIH
jgi:hypothetical protein